MILFDTNVFYALMQKRPDGAVVDWLDEQRPEEIWLPSVVVFELRYGIAIHPDTGRYKRLQQSLEKLMEELIQELVAPSVNGLATNQAALLAAQRKAQGRPVDLPARHPDHRRYLDLRGPVGPPQNPSVPGHHHQPDQSI
ncbi:PIN domain-containing protein [Vulcanococcus limneticus Candia 3F8]|uniref:PIN domain-containing protein n=1 Tax=Vulcanococcus limneticus TaxID=2170428 RepID=UPI0012FFB82F|nr:PIN domain-containing protein [Vulcanococcus limneticus]MCP9895066.1 PIN domain-containing protein [Vulcanococcus limneticus Candia 3F8]